MNNEVEVLNTYLSYTVDWDGKLSALRRGGIFNLFDRDAAEALQNEIVEYIARKRDLLRHKWAIQFFTDFNAYVNSCYQKINVFKATVKAVSKKHTRDIAAIQNRARSTSQFQIFLHSDAVERFNIPDEAETSSIFRSKNPIYSLVEKSENELSEILFDFAKSQEVVSAAVNVSIEQKMRSMTDEQLKAVFTKVRELSSPLWGTDTQGYLERAQEQTTIFTIGVYDQASSILKERFMDEFTLGSVIPTFASTHETDRITFFQSQCYSPAYAVNNMPGYKREAEEKFKKELYPVCYLDEKWNQRMIVEGFDVMPKQEKDKVLPNWVNAIVYGFVKYDESRKTYYMESDQGNILLGGYLGLGQRRDLAFEQFQIRGLDKEVESRLQQMVVDQGRPTVTAVIKSAKIDIRNYVSKTAQLSAIELDGITDENPTYQMVRDMLEKEVIYLKELDID